MHAEIRTGSLHTYRVPGIVLTHLFKYLISTALTTSLRDRPQYYPHFTGRKGPQKGPHPKLHRARPCPPQPPLSPYGIRTLSGFRAWHEDIYKPLCWLWRKEVHGVWREEDGQWAPGLEEGMGEEGRDPRGSREVSAPHLHVASSLSYPRSPVSTTPPESWTARFEVASIRTCSIQSLTRGLGHIPSLPHGLIWARRGLEPQGCSPPPSPPTPRPPLRQPHSHPLQLSDPPPPLSTPARASADNSWSPGLGP